MALETLIFHELRVYNDVSGKRRPLSHYRTPAGVEIDFIVEIRSRQSRRKPAVIAIEVKASPRWDHEWGRAMQALVDDDGVQVGGLYGVYRGDRRLRVGDVQVLPVDAFVADLHAGRIF
jgi:hypothetical protein